MWEGGDKHSAGKVTVSFLHGSGNTPESWKETFYWWFICCRDAVHLHLHGAAKLLPKSSLLWMRKWNVSHGLSTLFTCLSILIKPSQKSSWGQKTYNEIPVSNQGFVIAFREGKFCSNTVPLLGHPIRIVGSFLHCLQWTLAQLHVWTLVLENGLKRPYDCFLSLDIRKSSVL